VAVAHRWRALDGWQGHHHPGRAGRPRAAPPALQPFAAVPPCSPTSTCRWMTAGGRWPAGAPASSTNTTWPTLPPTPDRLGPPGRDHGPPAPPWAPQLPLAGGPRWSRSAGTAAGLGHQLPVRGLGRHLLPQGVGAWLAKLDTDQDTGGITPDPRFLPNGDAFWGPGSTRPPPGRGRLQRLLLPHPLTTRSWEPTCTLWPTTPARTP
jgi:methanethiol oxidase